MSERDFEKLSALLDDELQENTEQLVSELATNPELQAKWTRYQLVSDCMKQQLPEYLDSSLPEKVSTQLQDEPVVLAPVSKPVSNIFKPVAGFAIAASVAAVAILGIQQPADNQLQQATNPNSIASVSTNPGTGVNTTIPLRQVSTDTPQQMSNDVANEKLNRYLVNYNELRNGRGVQGIRPYVRVVAYDNQ